MKPGIELSIIVPVLNEEGLVQKSLARVREVAPSAELIVVDGGSSDSTPDMAVNYADTLLTASRGRSYQMNAGAKAASGKYLLFLHADTYLPKNFEPALRSWAGTAPMWGNFYLRLTGSASIFRLIERMINLRTKIIGCVTGDQCQIVRADVFRDIGGFPDIPLLEDVALSKCLGRLMPPKLIAADVVSSSRRWEERGIFRTILLMWALRLAYSVGIPPRFFSKSYRPYS